MEFDYELTKEDRKLFLKEYKSNKILTSYVGNSKCFNFYYWLFVILIIVVSILIVIHYKEGNYTRCYRLFQPLCIFIVNIAAFTRAKTNFLCPWNIKGKISLTYENLNIYGSKKFFSFNSLQVKEVCETENFYSILISNYIPNHSLAIIPKRLLKSEDESNFLKEFMDNYENKLKVQKLGYGYFSLLMIIIMLLCCLVIFSVFLADLSLEPSYNKELGISIERAPMITLDEHSPLKNQLSDGVIFTVGNKYVMNKSPKQINDLIENKIQDNVEIIIQKFENPYPNRKYVLDKKKIKKEIIVY